tara:strand:+ start:1025 stop:1489 length:465 start_codon:yes stop_codon:yes gene_type:complete
MLQFNKSLATNTNASYLATVNTSSGYYDNLVIEYSQSYDQSTGSFAVTAFSTPSQYNNWLVFQNNGADVPIPTGQYNVALYTSDPSGSLPAIWDEWDKTFAATDQTWATISGSTGFVLGDKLYEDRAFISGSNNVNITQYLSPNENGTYTTYNG